MATKKERQFAELLSKAQAAALAAGSKAEVQPMVLTDADIFGRAIPGAKQYVVADGPCGFAWVNVKPGNSSFANYLKKIGAARPSYYGGVDIPIRDFNQSVMRKEAAAAALASVLYEAGIKAYSQSRED